MRSPASGVTFLGACGVVTGRATFLAWGELWCSRPTRALTRLSLEDAGRIEEQETRYARKKDPVRKVLEAAIVEERLPW